MHRHLFLTHLITNKSFCASKINTSEARGFVSEKVQRANCFASAKRKQAVACYLRVMEFSEQAVLRSRTIASDSLQLVSVCRRNKRLHYVQAFVFLAPYNEQIVLRQQNESKRKLAICE